MINIKQTLPPHQKGFSLVELMVSITISLLLLAGVIQILSSNKQTYRVHEAMSRIQESGRFATQILAKQIRGADYWGCSGNIDDVEDHLNDNSDNPIDFDQGGIAGENNTGLNGSDTLELQGAYGTGITIAAHNEAAASFTMNMIDHGINDFDIILSTDCEKADLFEVTNASPGTNETVVGNTGAVTEGPGNATQPTLEYTTGQLFKAFNYTYSIKVGASGEPALFRSENGVDIELVEGVENMQILYGEDTTSNQTPNIYRDSASVTDMDNVISIRITLTLRTAEDNLALQTANGDKRIRRTFTTTTTIRNRVP